MNLLVINIFIYVIIIVLIREKIKTINDIIYISFDNYTTLEYHQMPQFDTNKEVLGLVVSNFNTDQINSISNKAASKLMQIQTSI